MIYESAMEDMFLKSHVYMYLCNNGETMYQKLFCCLSPVPRSQESVLQINILNINVPLSSHHRCTEYCYNDEEY